MRLVPVFILLLSSFAAAAQNLSLQKVETKTNASFRGLCVIDDSVAWVSGNNNSVGITLDGGKNWAFTEVKGFGKCDFRSIYAFDSKNAVIANAGSPAYVLRTTDGGATWQKVYENKDTAAFIDGMDFRDSRHGFIYGDPINNHMMLLHTSDGGKTWAELPAGQSPLLTSGEASFAASGTCIRYTKSGKLIIATGGKVSRLHISGNEGKSWKQVKTPILQGEPSTGIFSFLPLTKNRWVIAGGDYKRDTLRASNFFYTCNNGKTWHAPAATTGGYRECLEKLDDETILAVGPGGIDISYDNGVNWVEFSDEKQFHVVRRARKGNLTIIAGGGGKVAVVRK
jgi:photosystem II stability/assembly factor-like uncharacterized protein